MPSALSYPGIYPQKMSSGVRTITGVATATTAFVDFFARGPMNTPQRITSFADFERTFGGLHTRSAASYAIRQYYLNGGVNAFVVRTAADGTARSAQIALTRAISGTAQAALVVEAVSPGAWGNSLQVAIDHQTAPDPQDGHLADDEFNLVVREVGVVN